MSSCHAVILPSLAVAECCEVLALISEFDTLYVARGN